MHQCATLNQTSVRVEHLVGVYRRSVLAEEITQVHRILVLGCVVGPFQNLGRCDYTHITDLLHIQNSILRHTQIVDKVTGGLGVHGILGDTPTVEPYIRPLFRYDIVQFHALCGFIDSPLGVARPCHIHPRVAFAHLLFAEVYFPAGNVALRYLQRILYTLDTIRCDVCHQVGAGYLAARNLIFVCIQHHARIDVAESVFHKDLARKLRIGQKRPRLQVGGVHVSRIIQNTGCTPHIAHRIVCHIHTAVGSHLLEFLYRKRCHVGCVVGRLAEVLVYLQQKVVAQHTLNDILARANHVIVLVSHLYLGEHRLIDVESRILYGYVLARLRLVPRRERVEYVVHIDIVCPVIHLQRVRTVGSLRGSRKGYTCKSQCCHQHQSKKGTFHFFLIDFCCLLVRRLIINSSTRMVRKIRLKRGRNSGVRPPLRASA